MPKASLHGPFPLSFDAVAQAVGHVSAGVFALGYQDGDGAFRINAVGRSDADVAAALKALIGSDQAFKFDFAASPAAAFERECALFHDFRPPGSRLHPARPTGTALTCPRCCAAETW
ncbi:MAG: hypothetical protein NW215_05360 [Hyphomicrobiales bacterium]|nr:hypothetical protein [Hyphomicrobiales bacterium]